MKYITRSKAEGEKIEREIKSMLQAGHQIYGYFSDGVRIPTKHNCKYEGWLTEICGISYPYQADNGSPYNFFNPKDENEPSVKTFIEKLEENWKKFKTWFVNN